MHKSVYVPQLYILDNLSTDTLLSIEVHSRRINSIMFTILLQTYRVRHAYAVTITRSFRAGGYRNYSSGLCPTMYDFTQLFARVVPITICDERATRVGLRSQHLHHRRLATGEGKGEACELKWAQQQQYRVAIDTRVWLIVLHEHPPVWEQI